MHGNITKEHATKQHHHRTRPRQNSTPQNSARSYLHSEERSSHNTATRQTRIGAEKKSMHLAVAANSNNQFAVVISFHSMCNVETYYPVQATRPRTNPCFLSRFEENKSRFPSIIQINLSALKNRLVPVQNENLANQYDR